MSNKDLVISGWVGSDFGVSGSNLKNMKTGKPTGFYYSINGEVYPNKEDTPTFEGIEPKKIKIIIEFPEAQK